MAGGLEVNFEIIAEIGQNHNGDISLAKELILAAKENGADVAKFQLYNAKTLFSQEGNEWFDYNCKTELTRAEVHELSEFCQKQNIEFMASVFDMERIDWLEELNVKRYKVASRSIEDTPLINKLISLKKPLIVSLGWWSGQNFPVINSKSKVDFLYCVSKYPTELTELNLKNVNFENYSGFSDHTKGTIASKIAMARGAKIIEKHFTFDKNMYGPDHSGSITPKELNELVRFKNSLTQAL